MPVFIGEYLANTMQLSAEEHGAYFLLKIHYWRNGGPLENDKNSLKNASKVSWKKCEKILVKFFELQGGYWHHPHLDDELKKAAENKDKFSDRGRKAALARWGNNGSQEHTSSNASSITTSNAPAMLDQCPTPIPFKHNNSLNSITTARGSPVDKISAAEIFKGENLNDLAIAARVVSALLKKRMLSPGDQGLLAGWLNDYDMRAEILPVLISTLEKFMSANNGKIPNSLAYFKPVIKNSLKSPNPLLQSFVEKITDGK